MQPLNYVDYTAHVEEQMRDILASQEYDGRWFEQKKKVQRLFDDWLIDTRLFQSDADRTRLETLIPCLEVQGHTC